jgi:hypothetical protein
MRVGLTGRGFSDGQIVGVYSRGQVWNASTLAWEAMTQSTITVGELTVSGVAVSNFPTSYATHIKQDITNNHLATLNAFTPSLYDNVTLSYTGTNLTGVVFKLVAVTVSTLTLSYDGSNQLIAVVKN